MGGEPFGRGPSPGVERADRCIVEGGEQSLATRGQPCRQHGPGPLPHAQTLPGFDRREELDAHPAATQQRDGLPGVSTQLREDVEDGTGHGLGALRIGDAERRSRPVLAGGASSDEPAVEQGREQPVRTRGRDPEVVGDIGDPHALLRMTAQQIDEQQSVVDGFDGMVRAFDNAEVLRHSLTVTDSQIPQSRIVS